MQQLAWLVLAALLEVGGDALVRLGIKDTLKAGPLLLGALVLLLYGCTVNQPSWNFGRLLGVYIAVFFAVSQCVAVLVFHERILAPTWVGGSLIVAGGLVMTLWKG